MEYSADCFTSILTCTLYVGLAKKPTSVRSTSNRTSWANVSVISEFTFPDLFGAVIFAQFRLLMLYLSHKATVVSSVHFVKEVGFDCSFS